jgi:hypothetical protein
LPEPDVLAQEIADDMQTALEQFSTIAEKLKTQTQHPIVANNLTQAVISYGLV